MGKTEDTKNKTKETKPKTGKTTSTAKKSTVKGTVKKSTPVKKTVKAEKKPIPLIIIFTTIIVMVLIDVFSINFSSIFLILIGAVVGLIVYCINQYKEKQKPIEPIASNEDEKEVDKDEHLS